MTNSTPNSSIKETRSIFKSWTFQICRGTSQINTVMECSFRNWFVMLGVVMNLLTSQIVQNILFKNRQNRIFCWVNCEEFLKSLQQLMMSFYSNTVSLHRPFATLAVNSLSAKSIIIGRCCVFYFVSKTKNAIEVLRPDLESWDQGGS